MAAAPSIDLLTINTIRTLCMDAVQKANSGHPGSPMSMAPTAYTIWQKHLRYDPADPIWPNRDRYVLSAGHCSALIYSMLHLTGVKAVSHDYKILDEAAVSLDELKRFRQLGSKTPGHPEYRHTSGVETTTGPLGQGVANSVGMAIAARWQAAKFNRPGFAVFDYDIYCMCSDGDLMEGISTEAASLAGHLKLSNLCWIYDSNRITIEGHTDLAFSEDIAKKFEGLGWRVDRVADANDVKELDRAMTAFKANRDKPTIVIVTRTIAWGSPNKADTHGAHGEPLGAEEIKLTKKAYGWPEDAQFLVPKEVPEHFAAGLGKRGHDLRTAWTAKFAEYRKTHPDLADQVDRMQSRRLPDGWDKDLPTFPADAKGKATRESSGTVLNAIAKNVPWLMGGAADLAPSTKTLFTFPEAGSLSATNPGGRNMHFGIREDAMGGIINGMAYSKVRAFGAGFLIFYDYGRTPVRLAALSELPVIYVFTHDSIGVGEDGPTHQPIEHFASLRAIPNLVMLRPGDANEVVEAWRTVMQLHHTPAVLLMSRQAMPTFDRTKYGSAEGVRRGGYILADAAGGKPDVILIGTGSELTLCVDAYEKLTGEGIKARVVSLPSWDLFEKHCHENPGYRDQVLPPAVTARVSVEFGATLGWERYVGAGGAMIGMTTFGASAPLKDLLPKFGFTVEAVVATAKAQLTRK